MKDPSFYGKIRFSHGKYYGDPELDRGLQLTEIDKNYVIAATMEEFDNNEKDLIIQYSVKNQEEYLKCNGAFIKLGNTEQLENLTNLNSRTKFSIQFGPDYNGEKIVHFVLNYKKKLYELQRDVRPVDDHFTHTYTLWIKQTNDYEILIDGEKVMRGKLDAHFELPRASKKMRDPNVKKPTDWVNKKFMNDKNDKKPDDWDENEMGKWKPRKILNPKYKGKWKPKKIDNPNYENDKKYYHRVLNWIGIDVKVCKDGSVFDNFLVTDDINLARREIFQIEERKKIEKETYDLIKKKEKDRLSSEREKNMARQKIDRELKEQRKDDDEKEKKRVEEIKINKVKELAEKEAKAREEAQRKYLEDLKSQEKESENEFSDRGDL